MFTTLAGFTTVFGVVVFADVADFAPVFVLIEVDFAVAAGLFDFEVVVFFAADELDFDEVAFDAVDFAVDLVEDFGFGERNKPLLLPKSCPTAEPVKTNNPNAKKTMP
ncbi:MAG: hypothetical protein LUM44_02195 [Pyrinomonadaceae bacterium]|nr:hypothetical protein [Pyrinomonadaceae bacterium]